MGRASGGVWTCSQCRVQRPAVGEYKQFCSAACQSAYSTAKYARYRQRVAAPANTGVPAALWGMPGLAP